MHICCPTSTPSTFRDDRSGREARKTAPITPPCVLNGLSEKLETYLEFETVDLRDLMDACCQSDAERECLRLREAGRTFKEISRTLRIPLPRRISSFVG